MEIYGSRGPVILLQQGGGGGGYWFLLYTHDRPENSRKLLLTACRLICNMIWVIAWGDDISYLQNKSYEIYIHMQDFLKIISTYCFCLHVYFCRLAHLRWRLTQFGRVWFGAGLMCLSGKFWCICLILSLNIGVLTSEQTNVKGFESWFMVCYPIQSKAIIIF